MLTGEVQKKRNRQIREFSLGRQCLTSIPESKNRLEFIFIRFRFRYALCVIDIIQITNHFFSHFSLSDEINTALKSLSNQTTFFRHIMSFELRGSG